MMNNLVLCNKTPIAAVLELINKRNNINLSIPIVSRIGLKKQIDSKFTELELQPIPENWLAYSL